MYRAERILVDERIRTMHREAESGRMVAQARQAATRSTDVRRQQAGLSFGFLRRLAHRLVAA
jgi:hypothetical protein